MAKNPLDGLPFPPLEIIEHNQKENGSLDWSDLSSKVGNRLGKGVSICVVRSGGSPDRGGFFFHLKLHDETFRFSTFERDEVCEFKSESRAVRFINHVCGFEYSEKMWRLAQKINLRQDAYTG